MPGRRSRVSRAVTRAISGAYVTDRLSVVHGEPETHGEAWIPFARSKRGRSRQIADVAVDKLVVAALDSAATEREAAAGFAALALRLPAPASAVETEVRP